MINLNGIYVKYGDRVLLNRITTALKLKERIGLIGRNGAGKSTLLKIMANMVSPDDGKVEFPSGTTIGYLKQEIDFEKDRPILEETMECFSELKSIETEISLVNKELGIRNDYESDEYMELVHRLSTLTEQQALLDSGNIEGETVKVLNGLGFRDEQLADSVLTLSGGWKMRVELAKLLLTQPELLLLDEPTNHLDIESIIWLENYLKHYPGTIIIISHDTQFLDNVVTKVIEIELGKITEIKGSYSHFQSEKRKQREILVAAYANQQKMIEEKEKTINRFMAKATKTSMAQSMQKQLDKVERIQLVQEDHSAMKVEFGEVPRSSLIVYKAKELQKSFGDNVVIRGLDIQIERGDKIAFVGQNGQGKSTLAKIITGHLDGKYKEEKRGENVYLSYFAQNEADLLHSNKTVLEVAEEAAPPDLRSKVRGVLGAFLFSGEDVEKKVTVLSGGEKSRLALACKVMHPANLIVLDEPTNHLDIVSKNILKKALQKYSGALIVVSHDRHFLADLTDKVYEFRDHRIKEYLGDINYYLTKRQVDNIRDIEKKDLVTAKSGKKNHDKTDRKIQKTIERKIQYLERDINNLEESIKQVHEKMSTIIDYASNDFIKLTKRLSELQEELKGKETSWESEVEKLG